MGESEFATSLIVDKKWMNRRQLCRIYAWESEMLSDTRPDQIVDAAPRHQSGPRRQEHHVCEQSEHALSDIRRYPEPSDLRARDFKTRIHACQKAIRKEFADDEMFEFARPLAENGQRDIQWRLGRMYRDGRGTERDLKVAAEWMRKAANQNHIMAKNDLFDIL